MLEGSERLRERYRERFRHLLVDEFQDTNALQLKLIEAIRGPETRLFFVGDEFQSIYGFRHADVDVYRREHERFATGGEPSGVALPLTGNFRAAPGVVAATNAIGHVLLGGFEPLTAGLEGPADPAASAGRDWRWWPRGKELGGLGRSASGASPTTRAPSIASPRRSCSPRGFASSSTRAKPTAPRSSCSSVRSRT